MRNLKQGDFPGRKRLRADVFVHENYDRITNYADRLHTYLLPQKKKSDIESDEANSSATSEEKSFHKVDENWGGGEGSGNMKTQPQNWVVPAITNHTS